MGRLLLLLLMLLASSAANAGVRAVYSGGEGRPVTIEISDTGDISAQLDPNHRLIVRSGEAFVVEERLTGPLVVRLDDLIAIATERSARTRREPPRALPPITLIERGTMEIEGRRGRAYFRPPFEDETSEQMLAVISDDPALAALGPAMRHVRAATDVLFQLQTEMVSEGFVDEAPLRRLLDTGTPLSAGGLSLQSFEQVPIDPAGFVLPGAPEPREAMHARLIRQEEGNESRAWRDRMILRAIFAVDRLWLLTDAGALSSLGEGEARRTPVALGEPVLDICAQNGVPLVLTGRPDQGRSWTLHRWENGRWRRVRRVERAGDRPIALSCGAEGPMLVTSGRLVDLGVAQGGILALAEPLPPPLVRAVVHVTRAAVFVGINAGEWGGGLRRIDRRSGTIATIERNGSGDLCGGPLNTDCDPVNGLATIPWRPECVAAAVGLVHFMARGRLVAICPGSIEQIVAPADGNGLSDERAAGRAPRGDDSIAFFGLAARGDRLIAVGIDGLYRIGAAGNATHERWPRFVEVDGILVSFALPDVVLVMSELNRIASVSGVAPLLAVR